MRALLILCLSLPAPALQARVASETVYFLQPDGRSYLLERALRTSAGSHRFYVDKAVGRDDLLHVEPKDYTWDDSARDEVNIMGFDTGGFTVIFPGHFSESQLTGKAGGEYHYKSWDGSRNSDGRFGIWYAPGDFDEFSYTWILPDNIELVDYKSNRRGDWVRRGNAISFYANEVNNLTFELRYRVGTVAPAAACPQLSSAPAPTAAVHRPEPRTAAASARGCDGDCDGDGVDNRLDACPGTPADTTVDRRGCRGDGGDDRDGDGVPGFNDLCPGTRRDARVDRAGCSLDTDKDGVPDGVDRCLATAEGVTVDAHGCTAPVAVD